MFKITSIEEKSLVTEDRRTQHFKGKCHYVKHPFPVMSQPLSSSQPPQSPAKCPAGIRNRFLNAP